MLAPARPSEPSASFRCGDWLYHGLPISENRSLKSDNQMAQFEDLYSRGNLYTGGVYDTRSCPAAYAWPTLRTRTLLTREDSRNECSMHREGAGGGGGRITLDVGALDGDARDLVPREEGGVDLRCGVRMRRLCAGLVVLMVLR